jgi:hypothetical protein
MDYNLELLSLFPTTIGYINLTEQVHDLNIQLVEDALEECKSDPVGKHFSNIGGWHSDPSMEKKYSSFSDLRDIIKKNIDAYCQKCGYSSDDLVCDDLWININGPGDMNFIHHHGNSALTGVYYPVESIVDDKLNFNYTKSNPIKPGRSDGKTGGSLVFQNPTYGRNLILSETEPTPHNVNFFHVYPTSGVLILFQSNLLHQVLPFTENKKRMSISFSCIYQY